MQAGRQWQNYNVNIDEKGSRFEGYFAQKEGETFEAWNTRLKNMRTFKDINTQMEDKDFPWKKKSSNPFPVPARAIIAGGTHAPQPVSGSSGPVYRDSERSATFGTGLFSSSGGGGGARASGDEIRGTSEYEEKRRQAVLDTGSLSEARKLGSQIEKGLQNLRET